MSPKRIVEVSLHDFSDTEIVEEFKERGLVSYQDEENAINMLRERGYHVAKGDPVRDLLEDIYDHMWQYGWSYPFVNYMRKLFLEKLGKLFK